jgi:hypothetical protein
MLLDHRTRRLPVSDEQDALVRKFTRYGQGLPVICAVTLSVFSERTGHCLVEFRRSKLCAYLPPSADFLKAARVLFRQDASPRLQEAVANALGKLIGREMPEPW